MHIPETSSTTTSESTSTSLATTKARKDARESHDAKTENARIAVEKGENRRENDAVVEREL